MIWETLCVVFSMYSSIPTPHVEWNNRNMRYAMCLFPLVGAVIGIGMCLLMALDIRLGMNHVLRAALATALPVAVTGGIHLDGFCDTADALASHAPREKKLEILKDPHIGAFGVIRCVLLLLLTAALWCQLTWNGSTIGTLAVGFVFSRTLSGLAVVSFPCAKNSGLLSLFSSAAHRRRVRLVLLAWAVFCAALLLIVSPLFGCASLVGAALAFGYYHHVAISQFGGTTGDLAGFFLQLCECLMLVCCVAAELLF